jgi:hypothetical protein
VLKNAHLAVRSSALGLIAFIAGYLWSLFQHPRPSVLRILGVGIGYAAIFTVLELLFRRESLTYRCLAFGLLYALGFLVTHPQSLWFALGDWLFLALIYRFFVYDPREKSQAPSTIPPVH